MLVWMIQNWKTVLFSMFVPVLIAGFSFVVRSEQTYDSVKSFKPRIGKLEQTMYGMDAKFELIQKSLQRIEDREYEELKVARQLRQVQKP